MDKKDPLSDLSPSKGAYILQINVEETLIAAIPSLQNPQIDAGLYLYCGSANGPGGIRARVLRHLKRDKKPHWHVDRLTISQGVEAFSLFEQGNECRLIERLLVLSFVSQPYPGFGSSDCRKCRAHLVRLSEGKTLADCGFSAPVFLPAPDRVF